MNNMYIYDGSHGDTLTCIRDMPKHWHEEARAFRMPLARRFEQRFAPFKKLLRPPPFSSELYLKERDRLGTSESSVLLGTAAQHFQSARRRLDGPLKLTSKSEGALTPALRAEAMALVKVCVANSVVILSLERSPPASGMVAVATAVVWSSTFSSRLKGRPPLPRKRGATRPKSRKKPNPNRADCREPE